MAEPKLRRAESPNAIVTRLIARLDSFVGNEQPSAKLEDLGVRVINMAMSQLFENPMSDVLDRVREFKDDLLEGMDVLVRQIVDAKAKGQVDEAANEAWSALRLECMVLSFFLNGVRAGKVEAAQLLLKK